MPFISDLRTGDSQSYVYAPKKAVTVFGQLLGFYYVMSVLFTLTSTGFSMAFSMSAMSTYIFVHLFHFYIGSSSIWSKDGIS